MTLINVQGGGGGIPNLVNVELKAIYVYYHSFSFNFQFTHGRLPSSSMLWPVRFECPLKFPVGYEGEQKFLPL